MQSFLLVVCIIVLHDPVWIIATLFVRCKRAKWPPNRAAPSLLIGCALWPYNVVIWWKANAYQRNPWLQTVAGIAPGIKTLKAPAGARARPPWLPRGPRANHHLCALSHGGTVLSALLIVEVVRRHLLCIVRNAPYCLPGRSWRRLSDK